MLRAGTEGLLMPPQSDGMFHRGSSPRARGRPMPTSRTPGPTYSIASCVVETAHRLIASPDADGVDNSDIRRAGRALLTAEPLGLQELDEAKTPRRRHGQGIELRLGFYDDAELDHVSIAEEKVIEAIGLSIGGWPWGIQLSLELIESQSGWLGSSLVWPAERPFRHLDLLKGPTDRRCIITQPGLLQVIGRRLRYRIGVDHKTGAQDAFWWTTPQTEEWIARILSDDQERFLTLGRRRAFNGAFGEILGHAMSEPVGNFDPIFNSPDDWGFLDLRKDPIAVNVIGPRSVHAETHSDVTATLARAGDQIRVIPSRVTISDRDVDDPGIPYADALERLAGMNPKRRVADVVLLYRGGVDRRNRPLREESCRRILNAADELVSLGVEVVVGIGHGETSVHQVARRVPAVGVFEAVTPTAGASWILQEHVNQRLMSSLVDNGQPLVL